MMLFILLAKADQRIDLSYLVFMWPGSHVSDQSVLTGRYLFSKQLVPVRHQLPHRCYRFNLFAFLSHGAEVVFDITRHTAAKMIR
jgi:hypothetical protein